MSKPDTFETQRNGGSGGKKHLPRIHADERGSEKQFADGNSRSAKPKTFETRRNRVSGGKARHSGVTHDKSFKSGVETGRTPRSAEIARDRGGKPKTFETQRNRGNEGKKNLPRINADTGGLKNRTIDGGTQTAGKASDLQNMSVDGKRRVVDNSGQAGAATQQQGLVKADGMSARPFCALR